MNQNEFAQRIKAKYPEYASMDNGELSKKIIAKYPEYSEKVTFEAKPKEDEGSTAGKVWDATLGGLISQSRKVAEDIGTVGPAEMWKHGGIFGKIAAPVLSAGVSPATQAVAHPIKTAASIGAEALAPALWATSGGEITSPGQKKLEEAGMPGPNGKVDFGKLSEGIIEGPVMGTVGLLGAEAPIKAAAENVPKAFDAAARYAGQKAAEAGSRMKGVNPPAEDIKTPPAPVSDAKQATQVTKGSTGETKFQWETPEDIKTPREKNRALYNSRIKNEVIDNEASLKSAYKEATDTGADVLSTFQDNGIIPKLKDSRGRVILEIPETAPKTFAAKIKKISEQADAKLEKSGKTYDLVDVAYDAIERIQNDKWLTQTEKEAAITHLSKTIEAEIGAQGQIISAQALNQFKKAVSKKTDFADPGKTAKDKANREMYDAIDSRMDEIRAENAALKELINARDFAETWLKKDRIVPFGGRLSQMVLGEVTSKAASAIPFAGPILDSVTRAPLSAKMAKSRFMQGIDERYLGPSRESKFADTLIRMGGLKK